MTRLCMCIVQWCAGATLNVCAHVYSFFEVKNHLAARKIYCAIQSYTEFQVICLVATACAPKNDKAQTIKAQQQQQQYQKPSDISAHNGSARVQADKIAMGNGKCSRHCHQQCNFFFVFASHIHTHFSHLHYFCTPPFLRSSVLNHRLFFLFTFFNTQFKSFHILLVCT